MNAEILHLTLHRRWFDAIARGEKKEEYRAQTPFWIKRLIGRSYREIHFRNGYNPSSPWMRVECLGLKQGQWEGQTVFALQLGQILEIRNYPDAPREFTFPLARDPQAESAIHDSRPDGVPQEIH